LNETVSVNFYLTTKISASLTSSAQEKTLLLFSINHMGKIREQTPTVEHLTSQKLFHCLT